jgi:hypothetical protein
LIGASGFHFHDLRHTGKCLGGDQRRRAAGSRLAAKLANVGAAGKLVTPPLKVVSDVDEPAGGSMVVRPLGQ